MPVGVLSLDQFKPVQPVKSPYDFDAGDANIWRMVREAEHQRADIVRDK